MEIIIQPTAAEASLFSARIIARLVRAKPESVLGLATGSTPVATYRELVRMHREEGLDFSGVTTFNLDEYVGLPPESPQSYHSFMDEHLFDHINVPRERIHIPNGMAADIQAECAGYETAIRAAGGIDLQLLGIGAEGHIGLNEPGSSLASRTRIKTLTERTRADHARTFDGDPEKVPMHCITMGVGTIMECRQVLLLALGAGKAGVIAGACEGPITAMNPATILQMHPETKVVVDEPAAAKLRNHNYYRQVWDNKPAWQRIQPRTPQPRT